MRLTAVISAPFRVVGKVLTGVAKGISGRS
jgi:hypothetical protein